MKTRRAGAIAVLCIVPPIGAAQAPTYTVIHNFASYPHGAAPYAPLIRDANGDFLRNYHPRRRRGQCQCGL